MLPHPAESPPETLRDLLFAPASPLGQAEVCLRDACPTLTGFGRVGIARVSFFVSGHDFSRAVQDAVLTAASAAEGGVCFPAPYARFPAPLVPRPPPRFPRASHLAPPRLPEVTWT